MCDFGHHHPDQAFGYLVDVPAIRTLIAETRRLTDEIPDVAARVEALKPAFSALLAADGWLPDAYGSPDHESGMGGGIGQYALYRAEDGSLCLFSLVIPAGAETPVHDHLAWGLIGVYRGRQDETVYRRLDDGSQDGQASLEVARRQTMETGSSTRCSPARRHPLREDRVGRTVGLDSSVGQRHGVRVASSLRPGGRDGEGVPVGVTATRRVRKTRLRPDAAAAGRGWLRGSGGLGTWDVGRGCLTRWRSPVLPGTPGGVSRTRGEWT
ncbi:MAG: hypothetical protein R2712_26495 [Vicinamibacterales bacterium]